MSMTTTMVSGSFASSRKNKMSFPETQRQTQMSLIAQMFAENNYDPERVARTAISPTATESFNVLVVFSALLRNLRHLRLPLMPAMMLWAATLAAQRPD